MNTSYLRCEHLDNPIGLDVATPRLSWQLQSRRRGARQTAYHILVASDPALLRRNVGDVWDSGKVESAQSVLVDYAGPALASRQRVWWKVRAWDEADRPTAFSAPAFWEMGLLAPEDWTARWIGASFYGGPRTPSPAPYLRRIFTVDGDIRAARLHITSLGLYEPYINGACVTDDVFAPGWTDYAKRVLVRSYDVTPHVRRGENALGVILGDGWYCGHTAWLHRQAYGDRPKILAQLEIELRDGTRRVIATDGAWRVDSGPILASDMLMGESYDARREAPGWAEPGFDHGRWAPAEVFDAPGVTLCAANSPAPRRIEEVQPIAEPARLRRFPGPQWVFDFGQNLVGRVRLKVSGPRGTTITLRHAEMLNADGSLHTANLRSAKQIDYYTLKGEGEEIFEPRFTFHGFRYVELTGFPGTPARDALTAVVVHSPMEATGEFACDDPLINQLQHNIVWGQKGNFVDVPTDCPQRDERMGWSGDAQVFASTAAFNFDVAAFFTRWFGNMRDAQGSRGEVAAVWPNPDPAFFPDGGPAWSDAAVICPWTMYQAYGDVRVLSDNYGALTRFMDYLVGTSRDLIRVPPEYPGWRGFGDWLAHDGRDANDPRRGGTPEDLIGTAFLAYDAALMARIATILDKRDDAVAYAALFERVRSAFNRRFVTADGLVAAGTQTGYVLALHFGLLPDALRAGAAEALLRDIRSRGMHLSTGFVGSPYLPRVLSDNGLLDTAYALLRQTTCPSWLYPVTQGATTIWERWDSWTHDKGFQDVEMNSFNHYAYGAIGSWLYAVVAGIEPAEAGYRRILLRPRPGGKLTHARAALRSPYGDIVSAWRLTGDRIDWRVVVPPNTTAEAHVPAGPGARVLERRKPLDRVPGVRLLRRETDGVVLDLAAGEYRFSVSTR